MITIIIENSGYCPQVAGLYSTRHEAESASARLFECGKLVDYELMQFADYNELNYHLQQILSPNQD